MARREFKGGAPQLTLSGNIAASAVTTINTTGTVTAWPTGGTGKFLIVIDKGNAGEEKVYCTSRSGNALTVASDADRGADGTSAASHTSGASINHCGGAVDLDESNAHVNDTTTAPHGLATTLASYPTTTAMNTAIAAAVAAAAAPPIGSMAPYAGASAPTNWLLCNGAAVSRTTYAALFAVLSTTFGVGDGSTTFNVPDSRDKALVGASGTKALASTGGSADAIAVTHSHGVTDPNHNHTQNGHGHTQDVHGHGVTDPGHLHSAAVNQYVITNNAGPFNIPNTGNTQLVTFTTNSATATTGASVNNTTATNQATTPTNNANATGVTTNNAGSSGTGANVPPYLAVNHIIRAL